MNAIDAVEVVLSEAGEPLRYEEITRRILERDLWQTQGLTPAATVHARLAVDIKDLGAGSRFQRTAPGVFALRKWGLPEVAPRAAKSKPGASPSAETAPAETTPAPTESVDAAPPEPAPAPQLAPVIALPIAAQPDPPRPNLPSRSRSPMPQKPYSKNMATSSPCTIERSLRKSSSWDW